MPYLMRDSPRSVQVALPIVYSKQPNELRLSVLLPVLQKVLQRHTSSHCTHRHLRSKQLYLNPQDHNLHVHSQSWFDLVCLSRCYSRNQHTHCNVLAEGAVGIIEGDEDIVAWVISYAVFGM